MKHGSFQTDADVEVPFLSYHMIHQLSTLERRILYDYVVEVCEILCPLVNYFPCLTQVTSRQALLKLDPDLYRDDMAVIKGIRCALNIHGIL